MNRPVVFWLLAFGLVLPSGAQLNVNDEEYRQALGEAQQLMANNEFEAVIEKLVPLAEKFADRPEPHHGLGLAYYQVKEFSQVALHLRQALQKEKEDSNSWKQTVQYLGMAEYFRRQWTDAIPLLEKTASWTLEDADLTYALATCYLHTHEIEKTRMAYARLFRIDPDSYQAYILSAHLMYQASYAKDSETVLNEAGQKWPDSLDFDYQRGAVALVKGDYGAVVHHLKKELERNPTNSTAWHYLGEAYLRLSQLDEAAEALQRATWLNERSARSYALMGEIAMLRERLGVAEEALTLAVRLDPQDYQANLLLARMYLRTNRPELAKKQMEIADRLRTAPTSQQQ